jgi:hypothetical protein
MTSHRRNLSSLSNPKLCVVNLRGESSSETENEDAYEEPFKTRTLSPKSSRPVPGISDVLIQVLMTGGRAKRGHDAHRADSAGFYASGILGIATYR